MKLMGVILKSAVVTPIAEEKWFKSDVEIG